MQIILFNPKNSLNLSDSCMADISFFVSATRNLEYIELVIHRKLSTY